MRWWVWRVWRVLGAPREGVTARPVLELLWKPRPWRKTEEGEDQFDAPGNNLGKGGKEPKEGLT